MNPTSQEYFDTVNGLIGRGQMGQMNFFLFTIFYADKYGDKCYNQIVTTKPLQMGIIDKFKGNFCRHCRGLMYGGLVSDLVTQFS